MKLYYYLDPDIAIIKLDDNAVLFKSDILSVKLQGSSVAFLVHDVIPLLNREVDLESICDKLENVSFQDLKANLDKLVRAGVMRCSDKTRVTLQRPVASEFFNNYLERMGLDSTEMVERLKSHKIAIIGLEAHGMQTLLALRESGLRNFKIVDPFPCTDDFIFNFPFLKDANAGVSRQECVSAYFQINDSAIHIETGPQEITKELLDNFVADVSLLVVCMDKGFSSAFYWTNQISIAKKIPAVYSSIKNTHCFAGPFVIPEKTCCYMCYKMRQVATSEDFEVAMSYEEYLNNLKAPSFQNRSSLPGALNFIAGLISSEVIKFLFGINSLSLMNRIIEFDAATFKSDFHYILQKPNCPVCQKKKLRVHYSFNDLVKQAAITDLGTLSEYFISSHTGIIKNLDIFPKDATEPLLPYVYSAELANHSFKKKVPDIY